MARDVVMVNGLPGAGKSALGPGLADAVGGIYLSKDRVKEGLAAAVTAEVPALGAVSMETVYALAAALPGRVVIDSWWFRPRDLGYARAGLTRCGATAWVEVWCEVPAALSRSRFEARRRPAFYQDAERLATQWSRWAAEAEPLALGPVIRVDTSRPVDLPAVAAEVASALAATP